MTRKLSNIDLEREMQDMGISRYRASVKRSKEDNLETRDPAVRWLMTNAVEKMEAGVAAYRQACPKTAITRDAFNHLENGVIALIACKSVLDSISTEVKFTTTAQHLGQAIEDEIRWQELYASFSAQVKRIQKSKKWAMRIDYGHRRALLNRCAETNGLKWEEWEPGFRTRVGVVLIDLMRDHTGLIRVSNYKRANRTQLVITASPEIAAWIAKSRDEHEAMFPVYMPSTTPPAEWTTLKDGGYHTNLVLRRPLIKTGDAEHLKEASSADMGQVITAINRLQGSAWTINVPVLQAMQDAWDSNLEIGNIPHSNPLPLPDRPEPWDPTNPEVKAWKRRAHQIHLTNNANQSRRLYIARTLALARKFVGNTFYYPYTCDFRGRVYPQPSFLQPQGPGEARGLIRFAKAQPVDNPEALNWFLLQGANKYGYDKVSFADRIKWVKQYEAQIIDSASHPTEYQWWWKADSPWEFLAWAIEYKQYRTQPGGFTTAIPVALDGSNNGLQIYSLLMGDPLSGAATNCTASSPSDKPRDIYQDVADIVTKALVVDLESPDEKARTFAGLWLRFTDGVVPRAATKRPVMTLPYGSTRMSCQRYIEDWYISKVVDAGGWSNRDVFGMSRYQACSYLANHVWAAIGLTVGSARKCMKWLQDVAAAASAQDVPLWWTAPSGFLVKQKYRNYDVKQIRTIVGTTCRQLSLRLDNDKLSSRKQRQGVAPNFVHSLDASALVRTVNRAYDYGIRDFAMIHDSYGTTANQAGILAKALRESYAEMFAEPILERFREDVCSLLDDPSAVPPVPSKGDMLPDEVLKSTYFFS